MAASCRATTADSPDPPANHIIWRTSQADGGGTAAGAAAGGGPAAGAAAGGRGRAGPGDDGGLADLEGSLTSGSDSSGSGASSLR